MLLLLRLLLLLLLLLIKTARGLILLPPLLLLPVRLVQLFLLFLQLPQQLLVLGRRRGQSE